MPTIDEELVQNAKAHFASKTDFSDKATFGSDVEVDGKLQVNTATDIVTKDGTSIGGGEMEEIQINSGDIITQELKDKVNSLENNTNVILNYSGTKMLSLYSNGTFYSYALFMPISDDSVTYLCTSATIGEVGTVVISNDCGVAFNVTNKGGTLGAQLATIDDIPAVWAKYRHTVKIYNPALCASFCFTALSSKNTVIDSIQDLCTVFGNTELSGCGVYINSNTGAVDCVYQLIKVGTTISDTSISCSNDFELERFIDVFGTSGFTISDNVTQD